jgi:hypothetical protein
MTLVTLWPHVGRRLLSKTSAATGGINNPLQLPLGASLVCNYVGGPSNEPHWLAGTETWLNVNHDQERRVTSGAIRNDILVAATCLPDLDSTGRGLDPGAMSSARVIGYDLKTAYQEWRFDPAREAPGGLGYTAIRAQIKGAPAADDDTVAVAATVSPTAGGAMSNSVMGLKLTPGLTVTLGSYLGVAVGISAGSPVTVTLLPSGSAPIDPKQYVVSYPEAAITFDARQASRVQLVNMAPPPAYVPAGHIYGEPILVTWTATTGATYTNQLYVMPGMARFDYRMGFIKLRYYPVNAASIVISTAEGLPVTGWTAGEATVGLGGATLIPHGWLNLTSAVVTSPTTGAVTLVVAGMPLRVSYVGFSNEWAFFGVGTPGIAPPGSPAPAMAPEEQEVPVGFGPSATGVVMAGNAVHLGTEGYFDATAGVFVTPPGAATKDETFLSLLWDPVSNLVRGSLTAPAELGAFATAPGYPEIPAATGTPAVTSDGIITGSRIMVTDALGLDIGFVSALRSRETLVTDTNRVLRVTGQRVTSELTSTEGWEFGQDPTVDDPTPLPLDHPSKAQGLPGGRLLIVDTGNNRVVETDAGGKVLWPLDADGRTYNLGLLRPTDAERYETAEDPDGPGPSLVSEVAHTVIADSGHDRVVDVVSWWVPNFNPIRWEQVHLVRPLTATYVRDPADASRRVRAHYTQVELIRSPATGAVVGYLCGAPNLSRVILRGYDVGGGLVTDPAGTVPMLGGGTWATWSWLYTGTTGAYSPLMFAGLRGVSVRRLGSYVALDVTCLQYQGRYSDWAAVTPWWMAFNAGGFTGADPGAGVFEFRVSYAAPLGVIPSSYGVSVPYWIFAELPYRLTAGGAPASSSYRLWYTPAGGGWGFRPPGHIRMPGVPLGSPGDYLDKRFVPASAELLPTGRHLIANYCGVIERLNKRLLGQTGLVPTSEVLEVDTDDGGDSNPANDDHFLDPRRFIPDPYGPDWADPLTAPVYASRVMD